MLDPVRRPPVVSIVIVTFNAEQFLKQTLDSLSCQESTALSRTEVLIIDGGSTDATLSVARGYPCVARIVSEQDAGIYDAMNKGARAASGEWLHFLNAGDALSGPAVLGTVVAALSEDASASTAWMISRAQNMRNGLQDPVPIPNVPHKWWRHMRGYQPHCHQACWFHRDVFTRSGGYSLNFDTAADFDLIMRFGLLSPPRVLDELAIDYLGGGVSEKTRSRNPKLLHTIRRERMALGRASSVIDRLQAEVAHYVVQGRMLGGRAKALLRGARKS